MAYPTIRSFTSSRIVETIGQKISLAGNQQKLTFTRSGGKYVFTNYPEQLSRDGKNMAYTDNGYCTNRTELPAGEHHIFYSHNNYEMREIRYGVMVKNISNSNVTVTRLKRAINTGWSADVAIRDFYKSNENEQRVLVPYREPNPASNSFWVLNQEPGSSLGDHGVRARTSPNDEVPFHGILRIRTTGPVEVVCYAYKDKGGLAGDEVPFPINSQLATNLVCASGVGDGCILSTNINLEIGGNLTDAKPYVYMTSSTGNENDVIPILHAWDNKYHPITESGNYTAQYNFTVTIRNSSSAARTVYGFTSSNSGFPCFISNGDVQAVNIAERNENNPNGFATWRWFEESIPANSTKTFTYSMSNGTFGNAALVNAFSLNPNII